jgi:uncharacterized membrane protein YcaP (DUF421 family)
MHLLPLYKKESAGMTWLIGHWEDLGIVAAKAALMYLIVLVGLRISQRRTLAQWTIIDFAAAVATGAIMGRTAIARGQSFVFGAAALLTIITAHWVVSMARFQSSLGKVVDHRVRVLVHNGQLRKDQLRLCGITDSDLLSHLRQRGYHSLSGLRYVLYEPKGALTVVTDDEGDTDLVKSGLQDAAGYQLP